MDNENRYIEVFDAREDGLKCVHFESGNVGVVDEHGEVIYQIDKCRHIEFAEHDFLKLKFGVAEILANPTLKNAPSDDEGYLRSVFYVDMKSGQMYGSMPQILHRKEFELLYVGGFLCTRTRKCYMVERKPDLIAASPNGLYLPLTCFDIPDDESLNDVFRWYGVFEVCLLKNDDSKVYWLLRVYKDDSVLVMDENGLHTYVWMDGRTGKVTRRELGYMRNEAERAVMTLTLNDIKRGNDELALRLSPTHDIAKALGKMKNERQILVGFALETDNEETNAKGKLERKNLDFIVLNSTRNKGTTFQSDDNQITIIDKHNMRPFGKKSKKEVAKDIIDELYARMAANE